MRERQCGYVGIYSQVVKRGSGVVLMVAEVLIALCLGSAWAQGDEGVRLDSLGASSRAFQVSASPYYTCVLKKK